MWKENTFIDINTKNMGNRIDEREQIEQALLSLIENLADGILIVDMDGVVLFANPIAKSFFQNRKCNLIGQTFTQTLKPGRNSYVVITRVTGETGVGEAQTFKKYLKGKAFHLVTVRDITENKQVEEKLLKTNKLRSIDILAGGIAHDLNNIVTVILGYISMVKFDIKGDSNISNRLAMAEKASLEAKNLAQQLFTFSKGGAPIKKTASIVDIIKDSADFALRGSNVKCDFCLPANLWPVEIDKGQINQAFNNIIINARQAMPDGGLIKIMAENKLIDSDFSENGLGPQKGKHIKISIKDNGVGIPEKQLQKIFVPYFTSKQKGNGLGLATTDSIIKKHNGHIEVNSKPENGATFHIYLPASEKDTTEKEEDKSGIIMGKGRVLIMDDDENIRDVSKQMLNSIGYEVSLADDGVNAINLYTKALETERQFDAVIIDLTIPGGMGGRDTIAELAGIDPNVKAIVSSGYPNNPVMANFKMYGFKDVAAKPYKIEELSKILHDVITNADNNIEYSNNQTKITAGIQHDVEQADFHDNQFCKTQFTEL